MQKKNCFTSSLSGESLLRRALLGGKVASLCNVREHGLVLLIRSIQCRSNVSEGALALGTSKCQNFRTKQKAFLFFPVKPGSIFDCSKEQPKQQTSARKKAG